MVMRHLHNGIVEGEPGIFPAPIARVFVAISRYANKRKRPPADPPPAPDDPPPTQVPL